MMKIEQLLFHAVFLQYLITLTIQSGELPHGIEQIKVALLRNLIVGVIVSFLVVVLKRENFGIWVSQK